MPRRSNRTLINFALDGAVFVAFLVAMAPRFSGIAIHEWLSIAFGAAIVVHLLLHWEWIVAVTRHLFSRAQWSARVNYALNLLLFIAMVVVILTGLLISEAALPMIGIEAPRGGVWRPLHTISADLTVFIVGLHLALHWDWIARTAGRLLGRRPKGVSATRAGDAL